MFQKGVKPPKESECLFKEVEKLTYHELFSANGEWVTFSMR
jgi:hypothetical protein